MPQARIAAGAAGLVVLLLGAGWGLRLYSVPDPWEPYALVVREYLSAGLHNDSVALAKHSAAEEPAVWVHDAIRRQPATVAAWALQLHAITGFQGGETVTVALAANNAAGCSRLNSLTARLLNHSATPRVLALSTSCLRSDVLPLLPYQRRW